MPSLPFFPPYLSAQNFLRFLFLLFTWLASYPSGWGTGMGTILAKIQLRSTDKIVFDYKFNYTFKKSISIEDTNTTSGFNNLEVLFQTHFILKRPTS